ncbi:hypothetical protein ACFVTM_23120, partial [Arthrobacter sp. NPDC058130]
GGKTRRRPLGLDRLPVGVGVGVDAQRAALGWKAMGALRSDRTSLVIAQGLSTIRDAGLILVMEAGQIVVPTAFSGGLSKTSRPW